MAKTAEQFAEKQRRRQAGPEGEAKRHDAVASGEFVPRSLLDTVRERHVAQAMRDAKSLKEAHQANEDLLDALEDIRAMSEARTVASYAGGHRGHVGAINNKVRVALTKGGRVPPRVLEPPAEGRRR